MKGILLALILAVVSTGASAQERQSFLTTSPTPEDYAWWLRTEYHPFGTDVRGIPVAKVHAGWCKANEFRKDLFPPAEAASFEGSDRPFAVDGFFDGSKIRQTALVGVYETCKGQRGAFLLVLAWHDGKPAAVKFVQEIPGEREFATVGIVDASTLVVHHCMECDHFSKFRWNKARRRFVLLPPGPDE
ncbi:MAG TPA: hypothetical protein VGL45_12185 [Bradyrhizobium sp.]|jgi:hypothetical protein